MDWKKMVNDLMAAGLKQAEIATAIGCRQSYVSDLSVGKRGQRLSYETGLQLVALHNRVCPSTREAQAS